MFVQYYNKLLMTGSLRSHTYELYSCIHHHIVTSHHWIVQYFKLSKGMDRSDTELLLAIIAMELHNGRTSSFYEMLKSMKNPEQTFQHLVRKMQEEIETFDPHKSSGMYTSICTY